MTSPPTQLPPLPFRLFSYCHMRTWCLKSCCWSLEYPNGDIWYSWTLMNTRCSYRLIDRERYVWYVADTHIIIIIYIKLNINVYICTKTYLVLVVVVVQTLSCVQLFVIQHARILCPPLSPGVCSNSHPLSWWCYLTISSFIALFSFCLQSFPASGSFPMSQLFPSHGQSVGASVSASVLPMNIQCLFPSGLTGLILQSRTSQMAQW